MRTLLTVILLALATLVFGQDMSNVTVIPSDEHATTLSENELEIVGQLLAEAIDEYNLTHKKRPLKLEGYKFQYVPKVDKSGQKTVWINSLCRTSGDKWKTELIMVKDGGDCYFNLNVNLADRKYSDFYVNGDA